MSLRKPCRPAACAVDAGRIAELETQLAAATAKCDLLAAENKALRAAMGLAVRHISANHQLYAMDVLHRALDAALKEKRDTR